MICKKHQLHLLSIIPIFTEINLMQYSFYYLSIIHFAITYIILLLFLVLSILTLFGKNPDLKKNHINLIFLKLNITNEII